MNTIITIGRQFGSGGREIGEMLAKQYGIRCYDKELLSRAAKESGFCEEMIQNHDERPTNSFLYNLVMDTYSFGYNASSFVDMPISHKVFLAQFDTIKKIAEEGPCVIVGRCADYILREREDLLGIFIHAPLSYRAQRTKEVYQKGEGNVEDFVKKQDKKRASFYNYFSQNKRGDARHYHLAISSQYGVDFAVEVLKHAALSFPQKEG